MITRLVYGKPQNSMHKYAVVKLCGLPKILDDTQEEDHIRFCISGLSSSLEQSSLAHAP